MQTIFSDFSKRVEYIIDTYYDGNKTAFADSIGKSRQYVNKWYRQDEGKEKGKPNPSMEILVSIVSNTGVDPTWLLTGEGKPSHTKVHHLGDLVQKDGSLLSDLRSSDISSDEKIEFLSTQLRILLDLIEDGK